MTTLPSTLLGPRIPPAFLPDSSMMRSLPYLLLLPLSACFPLLDRRGPTDVLDGTGALAEGHKPHRVWGPSQWQPRTPQTQALLVVAKELQASRREQAGFRLGRRDGGNGEKVSGPLGNLAEELSSCNRKKGGFSFRFGR